MKLLGYEWKKLWMNAGILKMMLFLLVFSNLIFFGNMQKDEDWILYYQEYHNEVKGKTPQEALAIIEECSEQLIVDDFITDLDRQTALDYLKKEVNTVEEYEEYRAAIQQQYEEMQGISIFQDADWNQDAYMKRITEKYSALEIQAPMKVQPYHGFMEMMKFYANDLFMVILLLYLIGVVFLQEKKSGKLEFASTMIHGKKRLLGIKFAIVYVSMILYMLLNFGINLLQVHYKYGAISYSAAIQSVPTYSQTPYPWTIGQYVGIALLLKILAIGVLTVVGLLLALYGSSQIFVGAGLAAFVGIEMAWSSYITDEGIPAMFRYWNVWSFLRGKLILSDYILIRGRHYLIDVKWGILVLLTVLTAGFFLFRQGKVREVQRKWKITLPRIIKTKRKPHSLLYYEMKKFWIHQGGILLMLASILIYGNVTMKYEHYTGMDEFYYYRYIEQIGDRVDDTTDEKIRQEEEYLQGLEEELDQGTNSGKANLIVQKLERRGGVALYVDRVANIRAEKTDTEILKDGQYELCFGETEVSRVMVILLACAFAFLIPNLYVREKETQVFMLQETSVNGTRKLWNAKVITLLSYVISMTLIFGILRFVKNNMDYDLMLQAPIHMLENYWGLDLNISIAAFYVMGVILEVILAGIAAVALLYCAKKIKNPYVMTGMILATGGLPTLLSTDLPLEWLGWIHDFFFVFTLGLWR